MSRINKMLNLFRGKEPTDAELIEAVRSGRHVQKEMAMSKIHKKNISIVDRLNKEHSVLNKEDCIIAYAKAIVELEKFLLNLKQEKIATTILNAVLYTRANLRSIDIVRSKEDKEGKEKKAKEDPKGKETKDGPDKSANKTERQKKLKAPAYFVELDNLQLQGTEDNPEEALAFRDWSDWIMSQLDEKVRNVLLDKMHGLSNQEIADKYGFSDKASASVSISNYKTKLVEILNRANAVV